MTIETVRAVLAWSTLINLGLLLWWWLWFVFAHDWLYRFHGKWFKLSREQFDGLHYGGMGLFKIGIFLFNLVPYLAMRIMA